MYYGARYYDPWVGRFCSQDPGLIGPEPGISFQRLYGGLREDAILGSGGDVDPRNFNAYAYALNSPTRFNDPTGDFAMVLGAGCAASGACVALTAAAAGLVVANVVAVYDLVSNYINQQSSGEDAGKTGDAGEAATGKSDVAPKTHGNSKDSTKPQHRYEISGEETGDVKKTGISGEKLNDDGSSKRANKQVNKANKNPGGEKLRADVKETNIPGRAEGLKAERDATNKLSSEGNSLEMQRRPTPK